MNTYPVEDAGPFVPAWRRAVGGRFWLACAVLGLFAVPACSRLGAKGREKFPDAPVILISIDTLRADRLPAYGYKTIETPAIDAFRKDAILFENAFTHVPLTLPSHVSILTGRLPAEHGVHDNLGYTLRKDVETLPELLKRSGYRTGGAVSAIVLSGGSGFSRGFDLYDDTIEPTEPNQVLGRVQRAGGESARVLQKWIAEGPVDGKLFAFLHVYEPHSPYEPPEPFKSRYADPYDGEVATADAIVGDFLSFLREKGIYDRAIIVLLSDHGEGLGEHHEDEHGVFLYREVLRVPLLLKLPGSARGGTAVASPVGLQDVFPTVTSLLSLEPKDPGRAGSSVSLLLAADGKSAAGRTIFSETLFPRLHLGWSDLASLTDGRWHYIEAPRPEFYDMKGDPGELANLVEQKPGPFRAMRIEMEKTHQGFEKPGAVDAEQAARLASLGYISAGVQAEGKLPDPKDKIDTVRDLKKGFGFLSARRYEEAVVVFQKLLDENPRMLDVWDACSQALFKLGRQEEALAMLRKGIELGPAGATNYLVSVANLCLQMGRLDEAQKHAELALERGDPTADDVLSRIYLARNDLLRAEESARKALAKAPLRRLPYLVLARAEMAKGNLKEALKFLEEAEQKTTEKKLAPIMSLHQLKGDILGRLDRPREAEAEFLDEIRLFPSNLEVRPSLAILYGAESRMGDARRVLAELAEQSPTPGAYATIVKVLSILGDQAGASEWRLRAQKRFPHGRRISRAGG